MTPSIPEPLRAVAGLAAVAIDEARSLPNKVTALPVVVVGTAMQLSLRLQQRYAGLVARGDELLTQLRRNDDEPPPWATFDDEESAGGSEGDGAVGPLGQHRSRFDTQAEPVHEDLDEPTAEALDALAGEVGSRGETAGADRPPVEGYDGFTLPQLRARLRRYSAAQLEDLVGYERRTAARPPYLTMLENRLASVRQG